MTNREQVNGVIRRLRDLGRENDAAIIEKLMDECLPQPRSAAQIDPEEVIASSIIKKARQILRLKPTEGFILGCERVMKEAQFDEGI